VTTAWLASQLLLLLLLLLALLILLTMAAMVVRLQMCFNSGRTET